MSEKQIENAGQPLGLSPAATRIEVELKAQHVEIEQLKDVLTAAKRDTDATAGLLQTQVEAQQVEIHQLGADAVTLKQSTDASAEHLQTQIDGQQVEIVDLTKTVAGQAEVISATLDGRVREDEKREAFTDYLKAAAEDLRDQLHLEQIANAELRQIASGETNLATYPRPVSGWAKADLAES